MSSTTTVTDSASSHPVSYDSTNSVYYSINSSYPISNGYSDSSSTTYAQINLTRNANAETFMYYNFGFNIPSNATINSVVAKTKEHISSTNSSRVKTRQVQLFSGGVAKGSSSTVTSSVTVHTLSLTGVTWTAEEINNLQVRLYAKRGTSNTTSNYYFRFYGADVTVNYTYNQITYEITCTSQVPAIHVGDTSSYTKTYAKTEGSNLNIECPGDFTGAIVTDNGTDITSTLTDMGSGKVIPLTNIQADHTIIISLAGNKVFIKVNEQWKEAQHIYVKNNNTWKDISTVYKKVNGAWQSQSDKSTMFDQNALYLKYSGITIFEQINSIYNTDSIKYISNPGTTGSFWVISSSSENDSAKKLLYCTSNSIISALQINISNGAYIRQLTSFNDTLVILRRGSSGSSQHHLDVYKYNPTNGDILLNNTIAFSTSSSNDNYLLYSYNIGNFYYKDINNKDYIAGVAVVKNGLQNIWQYNVTDNIFTGATAGQRRFAYVLRCNSDNTRRYLVGYNGITSPDHAMNYAAYDSSNLSGTLTTGDVLGESIDYISDSTYILQKQLYYNSEPLIFRENGLTSGNTITQISFTQDFDDPMYYNNIILPTDMGSSDPNTIFFESKQKMWYLNTSGNIVSASINLL